MRNLPLLNYIVRSLGTSKVLVSMPDLILSLVWQPVCPNKVYFFVAILSETKKEEIIIYLGELSSIVVRG